MKSLLENGTCHNNKCIVFFFFSNDLYIEILKTKNELKMMKKIIYTPLKKTVSNEMKRERRFLINREKKQQKMRMYYFHTM